MTIQPVDRKPDPKYPDKYAEDLRRVLAAAQPGRWLAAPLVVGVLASTVALGLSGCREHVVMGDMPIPTSTELATQSETESDTEYVVMGDMPVPISETSEPSTARTKPSTTSKAAASTTAPSESELFITLGIPTQVPATLARNISIPAGRVVPLFDYGVGTGVLGCEVVAAPVFLSEEEAFAILRASFAEAGLALDANGKSRSAVLPVTDRFGDTTTAGTQKGTLTPDGAVNGIPVEFISLDDVHAWEKPQGDAWVSVEGYSMRGAADVLAAQNPGLVVFYDPAAVADTGALWSMEQKPGESEEAYSARRSAAYENARKNAQAESENLLRQQVRAFVEWVGTEGTR